jgi:hypothetical protein
MKSLEPKMIIERLNKLKGRRANWEQLWQEVYDYCMPRKNDITIQRMQGEQKHIELLDSTAMTSLELLAGALHGMLTNPSGYFFGLSSGIPEIDNKDAVRKWLQAVVRKIHDVLNNSNFHTEVHELYIDICSAGTACMYVEEDDKLIVRFSTRSLREVYLMENSKGVVDLVYRCYKASAKDLVDDFGIENLPKKVQDAYRAGKDDSYEVIHAVYPQGNKAGKGQYNSKFGWVSQYVLASEKVDILVKGYREFPYLAPRWSKASGEDYGRGCGEKALPSAKTANKMRETVLKGAQKVVDPPLQAPDDGFITQIDTRPAGITFYRAGSQDRIQPIFNDSRIDYGFQAIDQERTQIREAFYVDQLKLREGPQMTAREVEERVEQALRFLGPMLGRQQYEFLQPLVERVYAMLDRRGDLPEPPAELQGVPLKIQYTSVMAMSQRMSELTNIQRTFTNAAPIFSAQPETMDNIDGDAGVKYIAKICNFPQEMIRDVEKLQEIRKQRAEQQQAMQEAAQTAEQADALNKVAGAAGSMQGA